MFLAAFSYSFEFIYSSNVIKDLLVPLDRRLPSLNFRSRFPRSESEDCMESESISMLIINFMTFSVAYALGRLLARCANSKSECLSGNSQSAPSLGRDFLEVLERDDTSSSTIRRGNSEKFNHR